MGATDRDAPDDSHLSHQVHEGVFDPDQDVGGHPVAAALLDVGAGGVGVVAPRGWRSGRHGTVTNRAGAGTGLGRDDIRSKIKLCLRDPIGRWHKNRSSVKPTD